MLLRRCLLHDGIVILNSVEERCRVKGYDSSSQAKGRKLLWAVYDVDSSLTLCNHGTQQLQPWDTPFDDAVLEGVVDHPTSAQNENNVDDEHWTAAARWGVSLTGRYWGWLSHIGGPAIPVCEASRASEETPTQ